ncbi:MAG: YafY family transcriptional regulator [Chloroflexia bacterium]|nr:YafY family transcriptional regulator [Chloroflexia bacterium]
MNRTERLTGILIALQGGTRSASQLAQRFEVSRRTIMRDIDALGELGVPVVALAGRLGGYRVAEGFWLPPLHLSADEATVLLFALDTVGDAASTPLGDAHRSVLDKLHAVLNPDVRTATDRNLAALRVDRDHATPDAAVLASVRAAASDRTWRAIDYRSPDGPTTRVILPLTVSTAGGRWCVEAVDSLREAIRSFRIDRIAAIRLTVPPPEANQIVTLATSARSAFGHPDHPEVRGSLTPRGVALALDHPDFRTSVIRTPYGGELRFRCPSDELPYYGHEFIRFGTDVEIHASDGLRAWVRAHLTDLLQHHRPADNEW